MLSEMDARLFFKGGERRMPLLRTPCQKHMPAWIVLSVVLSLASGCNKNIRLKEIKIDPVVIVPSQNCPHDGFPGERPLSCCKQTGDATQPILIPDPAKL